MKPAIVTGEFLADLSHDLRTPLNGVIGFTILMREGKIGALSPDQHECLGDILTCAHDLLQAVNDISDLGKAEAGTLAFRPEPVDLAAVLEAVRDAVRPLSAPKQVQVTATIDPALAGIVTDPARLQQMVSSCVANAVKATPEGGRVTIRMIPEDAERFRIEIEDGGSRSRPTGDDAGLALTLSRRIAELQGGRLDVCSTADRGNVMLAVLPRAPEARRGG